MTFAEDNADYESWLATQCDVIRDDLDYKHERMTENAFIFLRATFFRWAKTIEALLPTLKGAPVVLSVGDAHLENFGTWRDSADRLVWGVNDFDDASVIQYPFDLVRLCTSALLVPGTGSTASEAAAAILTGYVRGLAQPRPTLVSDADGWMQSQLAPTDKSERRFWKGIDKEAEAVPPVQVQGNLTAALPPDASVERFASRRKGGGGLGRPRYLVIAVWRGQRIAREAKAAVPSAWDWAHRKPEAPSRFLELARGPYRLPDPVLTSADRFIIRRVAPDSRKIDIVDEPDRPIDARVLDAMGFDVGAIHASDPQSRLAIQADVKMQPKNWLADASELARKAITEDFESWRSAHQ